MKDVKGRTIVSKASVVRVSRTGVTAITSPKRILEDALNIINEQVESLTISSRQGQLDTDDQKALTGYVKALIDMDKNEREAMKVDPETRALENMSTEQILELAAGLKKLKDP